jgi:S1-C subfamily serine protease
MSKSQIPWPLRLALIMVVVFTGLAELHAQKAPHVSCDRGFAPLVKQVLPAVVNIASSGIVLTSPQTDSFLSAPSFDKFFGQYPVPRDGREHSLGSGVIVDRTGYVMTNNHVIEGASEIKIALLDKREFNARVIGADPKTDIALLKIEATDLPFLQFGDSSSIEIGEFVLAVGNPFGVGQTVTFGIVSATGRGGSGIEAYGDFIQTDAPINPGNSGGALVNVRGELVGINTAMVGGQGVGFAVPINLAQQVMHQIRNHGRVISGFLGATAQTMSPQATLAELEGKAVPADTARRGSHGPQFGVTVTALTPSILRTLGLPAGTRGVVVSDIQPGSVAAEARLRTGDVIQEVNRRPVANMAEYEKAMQSVDTMVMFLINRKGEHAHVALEGPADPVW